MRIADSKKSRFEFVTSIKKNWFIFCSIFLVAIVISPSYNLDVSVIPKTTMLSIFGSISLLVFISSNLFHVESLRFRLFFIFLLFFSFFGFSQISRSVSIEEYLFGVYGRNLGFISFFSLSVIAFFVYVKQNTASISAANFSLILSSTFVSTYYLLQLFDLDFARWEEVYLGTFPSTLGNAAIVSGYLGISAVPIMAILLFEKLELKVGVFLTIVLVVSSFVIFRTKSFQGFGLFLASFLILIFVRLVKVQNVFRFFAGSIITSVILSFWQRDYFGSIVNKFVSDQSNLARFDYYRASIRIFLENPIFGNGFDSFGYLYLVARDQNAVDRSAIAFSDSPHSLFFDVAVSGGLYLLVPYLVLLTLAVNRCISRLRKATVVRANDVIPLCVIINFILQTTFSPANIAILIVGSVYLGLALGPTREYVDSKSNLVGLRYAREDHFAQLKSKVFHARAKLIPKTLFQTCVLAIAICLSVMSGIHFNKDANFRKAVLSQNGILLIESMRSWPQISRYYHFTSSLLGENYQFSLAASVALEATSKNANDIRAWRLVEKYSASDSLRRRALLEQRRLDPLNPLLSRPVLPAPVRK